MVNIWDSGSLSCRLGGLFFDVRHCCARDSFAGYSVLYCGVFLMVSILVSV